MLKGTVSLLLIAAAIISLKLLKTGSTIDDESNEFKKILHPLKWIQNDNNKTELNISVSELSKGFKKVFFILVLFISFLAITLTYSSNPEYGFQKILNFIISVVPSVLIFYYLISTLTEIRLRLFIYSISVITVFSVLYITIDYPFDQSTIYHYEPGRWSHVIYGRMISSFAVFLLLYLLWMIRKGKTRLRYATARQAKDERRKVFVIFIASVAIYGTYISAFRAGFVGIVLVGVLILSVFILHWIRNIWTTKNILTSSSLLLAPFIIATLLSFLLPKPDIVNYRFNNMTVIDNLQFNGDPAIHSRLDYWKLSVEIIKENPVIGVGMGGFSSYHEIEVYPHNIILEFASEGGVVGLLVLSSLFVVIFKSAYRFSKCHPELVSGSVSISRSFILLFAIFALFLAMFSKEFSNQTVLWIGLAFVGFEKNKKSEEEHK